ncbi:hypothetical protein RB593_001687 [Gaeumannomyces tritici]
MAQDIPSNEPVAVVGSSCRFAGGVDSPSKLWDLLEKPRDLSKRVPADRFNVEGFYHPNGEYHGTTDATKGYWLEGNHRVFDASFFSITPKEAETIDPQQRLLLEVVYESLESAGYDLKQYAGKKVAVFAGIMTADFDTLCQRDDLLGSQYLATGNARSIISNRISYFYDFHGPSMTIDTACSASLVALHQAVLSLRSGESTMACVTGANMMLAPEQFITESSLHMLSPSGRCRMWDAGADGYARGEGAACLLLKPLSRALADGDAIQAIVRETGVNSDGRTKGITMPNPVAQSALIRDTYSRAGLDPRREADRCQYFEAHGTGTHAGDPREAAAIADAFFGDGDTYAEGVVPPNQEAQRKLLVGSVKTVIGHTEGAAGLAGVLKVIQAMKHKTVPPNLHLETLNPSVEPFYTNLEIPVSATPWPAVENNQPLRASVNSFGFGGTNSHAILERYTPDIHCPIGISFGQTGRNSIPPTIAQELQQSEVLLPLVLSANSQHSLYLMVEKYRDFLVGKADVFASPKPFSQLLYHLYAKQNPFPFRLAVTARTATETIEKLNQLLLGAPASKHPQLGSRTATQQLEPNKLRILGVFTGQGAQWATMSRDLFLNCEGYRRSISELDAVLRSCPDRPNWTLEQEILADPSVSRIGAAAISQPLCTALQVAMVDLLTTLGVTFHSVVGHSSGEIGAAYAAGYVTAKQAILIAYYRGKFASLARPKVAVSVRDDETAPKQAGGMIAVGLSRMEAEELCSQQKYVGRVVLAASNSPTSATLSGDFDGVIEIQKELEAQGKFARILAIDTAYHSQHMQLPAARYGPALEACGVAHMPKITDSKTRWFSSVHGGSEAFSAAQIEPTYWVENMTAPVLFREALEKAVDEAASFDLAIEVGPHPQLKGPAIQTIEALGGTKLPFTYLGVLDRKKGDLAAFSDFLGSLWTKFGPSATAVGAAITSSESGGVEPDELPTYPWDHSQVHYRESRISHQYSNRTHAPHELLGVRTRDDSELEMRWRNILKLETIPWIEHHKFQGQALLPASAYCVMALDAARVFLNGKSATVIELQDVEFVNGITIEPGTYGVEALFTLSISPPPKNSYSRSPQEIHAKFTVSSAYADGTTPMRPNFSGHMRIEIGTPSADVLPPRPSLHPETMAVSTDGFYKMMEGLDLGYTGPFRGIETIQRRFNFASTTLPKTHPEDTTTLKVSPAMLDTCFQACFSAFSSPGDRALWTPFLPRSISKVRFNMAVCDRSDDEPDQKTTVDALLIDFRPISKQGAATITGDMSIYNSRGQMEVQIESMVVASFAATKPEDDYELYLHTVMQADPEDEIAGLMAFDNDRAEEEQRVLEECFERVKSFYKTNRAPHPMRRDSVFSNRSNASTIASFEPPPFVVEGRANSAWPHETHQSLRQFIESSRYPAALELLSSLAANLSSSILDVMVPNVTMEALTLLRFQKHLETVTCQIAHRYPRMNILGVTDPDLFLAEHVLAGLGSSFLSFTTVGADERFDRRVLDRLPQNIRDKVVTDNHLLSDKAKSDDNGTAYDMVVLSTSVMEPGQAAAVLKVIRHLMKPGGFLVLIHASTNPLKDNIRRCAGSLAGSPSVSNGALTPPDWPDALEDCGFVRGPANADQHFPPGYTLIVRQAESAEKEMLRLPFGLAGPGPAGTMEGDAPSRKAVFGTLTSQLLIVGGGSRQTSDLTEEIVDMIEASCSNDVCVARAFEDIDPADISSCTAAIVLADLDSPVLSRMTEERLETLKALMRPDMRILWVTNIDGETGTEQSASFGFARTLIAEMPSLALQMLDLDTLGGAAKTIVESFARLCQQASVSSNSSSPDSRDPDSILYSYEHEIHIKKGRRIVPRVLPYQPAIDRVNSARRIITTPVNTTAKSVEIVPVQFSDGAMHYEARHVNFSISDVPPGETPVQVLYSALNPISGSEHFQYLCVGKMLDPQEEGRSVVMFSKMNASLIHVKRESIYDAPHVEGVLNSSLFATCLLQALRAQILCHAARLPMVLVNAESALLESMKATLSTLWPQMVIAVTSNKEVADANSDYIYIHPRSSPQAIKSALPASRAYIVDYSADNDGYAQLICDCLPNGSQYIRFGDNCFSPKDILPGEAAELTNAAIDVAAELMFTVGARDTNLPTVSVPHLLQRSSLAPFSPDVIVDWRAERTVAVSPTDQRQPQSLARSASYAEKPTLLRHDRTYVLIGITRDLGQSLCQLFVNNGARHIVLASRSPPPASSLSWVSALAGRGVTVQVETLDVTDLDSVRRFARRLPSAPLCLPPVAGVVNGAMVLEDRVFAQMTLETLNRVMRPKTIGSQNLDAVFGPSADLDFFIMTSSFAAVGGHAGQANYAAANMFMNGLAADRRRRGLAASVLNIGVIYGLGFLHREREGLYAGLEREGYPPISERDLHHMFVEAVVAGRPGADGPEALTTGLSRYRVGDPNQLHWHRDPRFCHFTTTAGGEAAAGPGQSAGDGSPRQRVEQARGADEVRAVVLAELVARLEAVLRLPAGSVAAQDDSVSGLGVDSLMAVELRAWLHRATGRDVPVMKILSAPSIARLADDIAGLVLADREV